MESIIPKCRSNNICSIVCNVITCKAIPFLCANQQCSCYTEHSKCISNIKWNTIKQLFSNRLKQSQSQLLEYFTKVNDLYKSVIKQIQKSLAYIKNISNGFNLSRLQREVYQKLRQKKFSELTGQLMNKVEVELMLEKKQFKIRNIEKEKRQIQQQTTALVQLLEELSNINSQREQKLDSYITHDIETIQSFFPKKIASINLLYRASENNFQVSKFHQKCDGYQSTIIVLKTQFGNIIGGYTPLVWDRYKEDNLWQSDYSMSSFIYSLTNKHKLQLVRGRQFAIVEQQQTVYSNYIECSTN